MQISFVMPSIAAANVFFWSCCRHRYRSDWWVCHEISAIFWIVFTPTAHFSLIKRAPPFFQQKYRSLYWTLLWLSISSGCYRRRERSVCRYSTIFLPPPFFALSLLYSSRSFFATQKGPPILSSQISSVTSNVAEVTEGLLELPCRQRRFVWCNVPDFSVATVWMPQTVVSVETNNAANARQSWERSSLSSRWECGERSRRRNERSLLSSHLKCR